MPTQTSKDNASEVGIGVQRTTGEVMGRSNTALKAVIRVPRQFGRLLIRLYQLTLSPFVGFDCRHLPTCSAYGDEALGRFGLWPGGWMTLARLMRCHPFGTRGLDFVPDRLPADARWYLPWRYGRWRGTNTAPPERPSSADADGAADQRVPLASGASRRSASVEPSSIAR